MMKQFLSCDWGTSNLRIRLVDAEQGTVLAEEKSDEGIAATFNLWQKADDLNVGGRVAFFLNIIARHIQRMEVRINRSLRGMQLIISGMASSSIGFVDIPYTQLPFSVDGSGVQIASISSTNNFDHDVLVISGVKSDDDVMRGEETQLIGSVDPSTELSDEIFIFPGTHSKHIEVKNRQVTGFKTYMTGEFFELLSQKSILRNSVEKTNLHGSPELKSFRAGVHASLKSNLLSAAFKVRTNHLFELYTKQENMDYLSGLLIGTELNELHAINAGAIHLICGSNLEAYYKAALQEAGLFDIVKTYPSGWVDKAVARGQSKIYNQLYNKHE